MGAAAAPAWLIPVLIGTTVVTGVISAKAQADAGKAQKQQADMEARREGDAARGREVERRRALLRAIATQAAEAGAGGISFEGAMQNIAQRDIEYASDDLLADEANTKSIQARLRAQGSNAARAGRVGAVTTLLDTGVKAGSLWGEP